MPVKREVTKFVKGEEIAGFHSEVGIYAIIRMIADTMKLSAHCGQELLVRR
jgi:hypothetical protein